MTRTIGTVAAALLLLAGCADDGEEIDTRTPQEPAMEEEAENEPLG